MRKFAIEATIESVQSVWTQACKLNIPEGSASLQPDDDVDRDKFNATPPQA